MAFLRAGIGSETAVAQGRGLWLRAPLMGDYGPWAELRTLSRAHLVPWEPAWPRDDLSKSGYRRRLRHYQREARDDLGYAFLMFEAATDNPAYGRRHAVERSAAASRSRRRSDIGQACCSYAEGT